MTHQEMLDQVSDELRNKSIETKITRWLNQSILDICMMYVFGKLTKYINVNTTPNIPDVALPTDFLWPRNMQMPVDNVVIYPRDEDVIAAAYPQYRTQKGTITHYYINGTTLGTWMVSGTAKNITGAYQSRPLKLLADKSVSCDLPEEWHDLACQKAITKGHRYDGQLEEIALSEKRERVIEVRIGASAYKRPDDPLIMGDTNYRTKPLYPRLPQNYPPWRR